MVDAFTLMEIYSKWNMFCIMLFKIFAVLVTNIVMKIGRVILKFFFCYFHLKPENTFMLDLSHLENFFLVHRYL